MVRFIKTGGSSSTNSRGEAHSPTTEPTGNGASSKKTTNTTPSSSSSSRGSLNCMAITSRATIIDSHDKVKPPPPMMFTPNPSVASSSNSSTTSNATIKAKNSTKPKGNNSHSKHKSKPLPPKTEQPKSKSKPNLPPTTPVKVRHQVSPNPEQLSQVGCRCLVIDLPGVLKEHIQVGYYDSDLAAVHHNHNDNNKTGSFVRVTGQRTVGRTKAFRKVFPLEQDLVVTRMLTAYLHAGVLLIVVPTKLAASMAAAAMICLELKRRPEQFESGLFKSKKPMLLLAQDSTTIPASPPAEDIAVETAVEANVDSDDDGSDTEEPPKIVRSAFQPYVAQKAAATVAAAAAMATATTTSTSKVVVEPKARPPSTSSIDGMVGLEVIVESVDNSGASEEETVSTDNSLVQKAEHTMDRIAEFMKGQQQQQQDPMVIAEPDDGLIMGKNNELPKIPEETSTTDTSTMEDVAKVYTPAPIMNAVKESAGEKPVKWTDDSLTDEPSLFPAALESPGMPKSDEFSSPPRKDASYYYFLPNKLSNDAKSSCKPISDPEASTPPSVSSTGKRYAQPLTWIQFDNTPDIQDEEFSAVTHNSALFSSGASSVTKNVKNSQNLPMMPTDEAMQSTSRVSTSRSHRLQMELEPHPYWQSAPFLPRPTNSLLDQDYDQNVDQNDDTAVQAWRNLYLSKNNKPKAPSPSSLLRRGARGRDPPTTRKTVTWIDEI